MSVVDELAAFRADNPDTALQDAIGISESVADKVAAGDVLPTAALGAAIEWASKAVDPLAMPSGFGPRRRRT